MITQTNYIYEDETCQDIDARKSGSLFHRFALYASTIDSRNPNGTYAQTAAISHVTECFFMLLSSLESDNKQMRINKPNL